MSDFGVEPVTFLEIDQEQCQLRWGETNAAGTCPAALGVDGTRKCTNTRATCPVIESFTPGTLTLRFAKPQRGLLQYGPVIPSIQQLVTTPGKLNLAGMDRSQQALGSREVVTVDFDDHLHDDQQVDPYRLERQTGEALAAEYLELPGTAGNTATTPDSAAASITGDIDVRMKIAANDWTPAVVVYPFEKYTGAPNGSWVFGLSGGSSGRLAFEWVDAGGTLRSTSSSVSPAVNDGAALWVRATLDVDNGAGGHVVKYFTSPDGLNWTQLGTDRNAGAFTTSIKDDADPVRIGRSWAGKFYYGEIRNGIDGAVVVAFDAGRAGQGKTTVLATTGETWTINQSGSPAAQLVNVSGRYDPYKRGSFWGKWTARNPYFTSFACRVRQGEIGQALDDMRVRHYVLESLERPVDGAVQLVAMDLFARIESRRAVAPRQSLGRLKDNITAGASSGELVPAGIGNLDYPASGHVWIGDEGIAFTRAGDVLTFTGRGALGSTAEAHNADDHVQLVYEEVAQRPHDIAERLLLYGGISASVIPKATWDLKAAEITELYTGYITKPTPILELLGELSMQAGFTLWADTTTNTIQLESLRERAPSATIRDGVDVIDGSLELRKRFDRRLTTVIVYYAQKNPNLDLDERRNYRSRAVVGDDEAAALYGSEGILEVFSRWIPTSGRQFAVDCGTRILSLHVDPPDEAVFRLVNRRASELGLAQFFSIEVYENQDDTGATAPLTMACVALQPDEVEPEVEAVGVKFAVPLDTSGKRTIVIENELYNVTLRQLHDSIYPPPVGDEVIEFIVLEGFSVGSTSPSAFAMDTGDWPAMTTPPRLVVMAADPGAGLPANGIQGCAGRGGHAQVIGGVYTAGPGQPGGPALKVRVPFTLSGNGRIWGGAGGGGAGGPGISPLALGGGGGGGMGLLPGPGGVGYNNGSPGTPDSGGIGGNGNLTSSGKGGQGGSVLSGLVGFAGQNGTGNVGGAGGAAGVAIDGWSLVTLDGEADLDIRGATIN